MSLGLFALFLLEQLLGLELGGEPLLEREARVDWQELGGGDTGGLVAVAGERLEALDGGGSRAQVLLEHLFADALGRVESRAAELVVGHQVHHVDLHEAALEPRLLGRVVDLMRQAGLVEHRIVGVLVGLVRLLLRVDLGLRALLPVVLGELVLAELVVELLGDGERRVAVDVAQVDVRVMLEQVVDDRRPIGHYRDHDGRAAERARVVDTGAVRQQLLDERQVATMRSDEERYATAILQVALLVATEHVVGGGRGPLDLGRDALLEHVVDSAAHARLHQLHVDGPHVHDEERAVDDVVVVDVLGVDQLAVVQIGQALQVVGYAADELEEALEVLDLHGDGKLEHAEAFVCALDEHLEVDGFAARGTRAERRRDVDDQIAHLLLGRGRCGRCGHGCWRG